MKKESLILCDSNVCIYRTLALIEPRILIRDILDRTHDMISNLSNNNFACKILISDIISEELKNSEILFQEISEFCINKLHLNNSYKILKLAHKAEKSIDKFLNKRIIEKKVLEEIKNYKTNLQQVNEFYLKYPEKLKNLTISKTRHLKPFDLVKKIKERPNNLPEETDRLVLAQAIELNKIYQQDVCIFSNDGDFTEFKEEILKKFGVIILSPNDQLTLEE